jgi:phage portal protein BeeE
MSNLTAAEAAEQITKNDRHRALNALREEKRKTDAVKGRAKKQQARFDKAVALAVSSRPGAENWYEYPGPLNRDEVREALSLSKEDLPALMRRYARRTV